MAEAGETLVGGMLDGKTTESGAMFNVAEANQFNIVGVRYRVMENTKPKYRTVRCLLGVRRRDAGRWGDLWPRVSTP